MPDATPQGDPHLQPIQPQLKVEKGVFDPCIVYLETTLSGEIPLLGACWSATSHEKRAPDGRSLFVLENVVVIQNQRNALISKSHLWDFVGRREDFVFLIPCPSDHSLAKVSFCNKAYEVAPEPVFRWSVRHLDQETDASLRQVWKLNSFSPLSMVKPILKCANVEWPSIAEALASFETKKQSVRVHTSSFINKLFSFVFEKKNSKPAAT